METFTPANKIVESLVRFRKWWLVPTAACTLMAIMFALFSSKSYTTRQTLVVRDDLVGTFFKPGRFDSLDSMKSAQETILEISRRPHVVRTALKKLGPPRLTTESSWLSDQNIQSMQGKIQIGAPNGAEFGRTEAIVLSVQSSSRERSREYIGHLLDEIEGSIQNLRVRQSESMQMELQQAATVAETTYRNVATQLKAFESSVGSDLGTLISLNDSQSGTNHLQSEMAELNIELRKARGNLEDVKKQIQILSDVSNSPEDLLAVPQELLQLQPTLASLARGLNDAVLRYSKTKGRYKQHPRIGEDRRAVEDIKERINEKLADTISSLQYQLELREDKYGRISKLIGDKKIRLGELSSMRVDYATLREEVAKKREINGKAQASLAEIQSLAGRAQNINLISRVDEPQTGIYPDGPSNKVIVFGGMLAGMFIGFGLVMFVAPLDDPESNDPGTTNNELENSNSKSPVQNVPVRSQQPVVPVPSNSISAQIAQQKQQDQSNHEPVETSELVGSNVQSGGNEVCETEQFQPVSAKELSSQQNFETSKIATPTETSTNAAFVSEPPKTIDSETKLWSSITHQTQNFVSNQLGIEPNTTQTAPQTDSSISTLDQQNNATFQVPEVDAGSGADLPVPDSNSVLPIQNINSSSDETQGAGAMTEKSEISQVDSKSQLDPAFDSIASKIALAETPEIEAREIDPTAFALANMRAGEDNHHSIAEKISQIEQGEIGNQNTENSDVKSISNSAAVPAVDQANEPPSANKTSTGLPLPTSIEHSSNAQAEGNESDPQIGTEPEHRPTATTVDLRMLKNQLSGKMKAEKTDPAPRKKKLSEVLAKCEDSIADNEEKNSVVDRSISDLASSIRDMCQRDDRSE